MKVPEPLGPKGCLVCLTSYVLVFPPQAAKTNRRLERVRTERPAVDLVLGQSLRARLSGRCVGRPDGGDADRALWSAVDTSHGYAVAARAAARGGLEEH